MTTPRRVTLTLTPGESRMIYVSIRADEEHKNPAPEVFKRICTIEGATPIAQSGFDPKRGFEQIVVFVEDVRRYNEISIAIGNMQFADGFKPISGVRPGFLLDEQELEKDVSYRTVGAESLPKETPGPKKLKLAFVVSIDPAKSSGVITQLQKTNGVKLVDVHNPQEVNELSIAIDGDTLNELSSVREEINSIDGVRNIVEAHLVVGVQKAPVRAYAGIRVKPDSTEAVIAALLPLTSVVNVDPTVGPYDIIALIEGRTDEEIGHIVTNLITSLVEVEAVETCLLNPQRRPLVGQVPATERRVECLHCRHKTKQTLLLACEKCKKGPLLQCSECGSVTQHSCKAK